MASGEPQPSTGENRISENEMASLSSPTCLPSTTGPVIGSSITALAEDLPVDGGEGASLLRTASSRGGIRATGGLPCPSPSGRMLQPGIVAANVGHAVIIVDNVRFTLDLDLLRSKPDTMLGRMFSDGAAYSHPNEKGEHRILDGISAAVFEAVLGYYSGGVIRIPPEVPFEEVREACDYLLIPFSAATIRTQNLRELLHLLSNEGAQKRFDYFLDTLLLPKMAESARLGDRECHVVILMEEDTIEWDSNFPPPAGTEHTLTVFSTELCKFFKYAESRDVAKRLLKDRGLKKIRLGIEGYPTCKEKVKISRQPGQPPEVIYSYVQRPFVHVSWQKEESRSRHVDFQCVRSKPQPNPAAAADAQGMSSEELSSADHASAAEHAGSLDGDVSRGAVESRQQLLHRRLQRGGGSHDVRDGCSCAHCRLLLASSSPEPT